MKHFLLVLFIALLVGCQPPEDPVDPVDVPEVVDDRVEVVEPEEVDEVDEPEVTSAERLAAVLAAQPENVQARYPYRNPQETLNFFGIKPGMTLVEGLPGGGWYTRILLAYLGEEGRVIGANYPIVLFEQFEWASDEFLENLPNWPDDFASNAAGWCEEDCAAVDAFWLGDLPSELEGSADAVIFIRALHNLARFQHAGVDDFLDQALADAYAALKPGGTLGIVQHEAREDMPDEWASGEYGYIKKSMVIAHAEAAGFELVRASDINENPLDQPTTDDMVWRLPPTLATSREDPELRAEMEAIGESHRMTLKFRKPAEY